MGLHPARKKEIVEHFKQSDSDTGSPEVQVALLTERIQYLTEHFKENHKDHHDIRVAMNAGVSTYVYIYILSVKKTSRVFV